jgi:hypothetical protein
MIDLYINRKLEWWGYLLMNGEFYTRRYLGNYLDIIEAQESDFVEFVVEPFGSSSADNAKLTVELECMKHLMNLK